jgi:dihydrofolate synthase / folylpolyglutamate synthase
LQKLTQGVLFDQVPEGGELWVDGGHNPGAAEAIAEAMANLEEYQSRPLYLITGMLNTKDPVGYFRPFAGIAVHVYGVPIEGTAAGLDPVVLAGAAYDAGLVAEPVSSVGEALGALRLRIGNGPAPRILIGGSLYLAGNVLAQNGTLPR